MIRGTTAMNFTHKKPDLERDVSPSSSDHARSTTAAWFITAAAIPPRDIAGR